MTTVEDKVRELEAKVEAYKMLIDKALDMAMSALVEARTFKAAVYQPPPIEELKKELLEEEIPVKERISPFSFRGKIDTEKGTAGPSGAFEY